MKGTTTGFHATAGPDRVEERSANGARIGEDTRILLEDRPVREKGLFAYVRTSVSVGS